MKFINSKKINKNSGFTLIEVLVALTLFTFAITGVITIALNSTSNINNSKNRLVANYLAQEGIELMRAKRDSYVLSGSTYLNGWQNFITDVGVGCSGPCDLDANSLSNLVPSSGQNVFYSCPSINACKLNYSTDGFYIHGTGTPTIFSRELTFVTFNPNGTIPTELEVTSTVYWKDGVTQKSLSMNESLFNWYTTQ